MEIEAYLRRFVNQGSPVIPVLLHNAPKQPELPIFLEGMTWVDFRQSESNAMGRLIWGITGVQPKQEEIEPKEVELPSDKEVSRLLTFPPISEDKFEELLDELVSEFEEYFADARDYIIPSGKDEDTGERLYIPNVSATEMETRYAVEELLYNEEVQNKYPLLPVFLESEETETKLLEKLIEHLDDGYSWLRTKDIKNSYDNENQERWNDEEWQQRLSSYSKPDEIEHRRAKGVDYTKLRDLLETGKWKDADEETSRLMLQIGDKEEKGYLDSDDCRNFPQKELRSIDRLWLKYSKNRFGLSVQKEIYL